MTNHDRNTGIQQLSPFEVTHDESGTPVTRLIAAIIRSGREDAMIFEEARRLARSLRRTDDWDFGSRYYLVHKKTGFAVWVGSGMFFVQPYLGHDPDCSLMDSHPSRYGLLEKLIIWFGGARRWARAIERASVRQACFRGDA